MKSLLHMAIYCSRIPPFPLLPTGVGRKFNQARERNSREGTEGEMEEERKESEGKERREREGEKGKGRKEGERKERMGRR